MRLPVHPTDYRWVPRQVPGLEAVMRSWEGTPYKAGQRAKRLGVDCVHLVAGVFDELLERVKPTDVPRLPPDTGTHNPNAAMKTIRALMEAYHAEAIDPENPTLAPGDVVVVSGNPQGTGIGLNHCLICAPRKHLALHASSQGGVCRTGLGSMHIMRVYRSRELDAV